MQDDDKKAVFFKDGGFSMLELLSWIWPLLGSGSHNIEP